MLKSTLETSNHQPDHDKHIHLSVSPAILNLLFSQISSRKTASALLRLTSITYFARWGEEGLDYGKDKAMVAMDFGSGFG